MGFEPREFFSHIKGRRLVLKYDDGRVKVLDGQSEVANMSKIKEVTDFMKNDVADMQRQAGEVHALALQVKDQFNGVLGLAKNQLSEAQRDLMELQAAMGGTSNFPPESGT